MALDPQRHFPLMCLTRDAPGEAHAEQAAGLCEAGARWIQLRMKGASDAAWLAEAAETAAVCRARGAVLIVNDSVEVALESGADGVHLGSLDCEWRQARRRLGKGRILGGTVNNSADAARALGSGALDYVGVGPLRFTATKQNLAPVLGLEGIRDLISSLGGLPAWVIGGVEPADVPELLEAGASGVAVSSALYRGGRVAENLRAFLDACAVQGSLAPAHPSSP